MHYLLAGQVYTRGGEPAAYSVADDVSFEGEQLLKEIDGKAFSADRPFHVASAEPMRLAKLLYWGTLIV